MAEKPTKSIYEAVLATKDPERLKEVAEESERRAKGYRENALQYMAMAAGYEKAAQELRAFAETMRKGLKPDDGEELPELKPGMVLKPEEE